jgi:hypothetical protein
MKLTSILAGFALAIGIGAGMNAHAFTLHECCQILQEECELNYEAWRCAGVYERCVASRRCILP